MNEDIRKNISSALDIQNNELSDEALDAVVGGHGIGDTVRCSKSVIDYCSKCGKLLMNYEVTITGVRGVLDGKTVYWVTRNCCGSKTGRFEDRYNRNGIPELSTKLSLPIKRSPMQ